MIAAFIAMLPREELAHSRYVSDAERETLANLAQRKANRPQHIAAGHKAAATKKRNERITHGNDAGSGLGDNCITDDAA